MVRIGGKPILWHIMKIYYAQGFRQFILLLGYKGEHIRAYVKKVRGGNEVWNITCVDTGLDTQTGGRLKQLETMIRTPFFMLTYGDGVCDVNLRKLIAYHDKKKKTATLSAVHPPVRFGQVVFDERGNVKAFREKPDPITHRSEHLINGGFFVVDTKIFRDMSDDKRLVFERDVLGKLAKKRRLAALPHKGYWQCMDTIRDMEVLNEAWKSGKAPWKIW